VLNWNAIGAGASRKDWNRSGGAIPMTRPGTGLLSKLVVMTI
jgi:hypothetical protein